MIPKIIHYIWLGEKRKSILSTICIRSWEKYLSDYQIIEWNESNLDLDGVAANNRFFAECRKHKLWAYMADYLRLKILYEHGGIYFDADVEVLKSFDDLIDNSFFIGMEALDYIGTGIIAAEPHNPVVKRILEFYDNEIWDVDFFTIPKVITHIFDNNPEIKSQATIYPMDTFAPYDPYSGYKEGCITENSYSIHWFQAGWVDSPGIRKFLSVKHIKNPIFRCAIVLKNELKYCLQKIKIVK